MIGPILRYVEYVPRVSINVKQSTNTHRAFKEWYDMFAELDANGMTVEFQTKEDTINEYHNSGHKSVRVEREHPNAHHIPFHVSITNDLKANVAHAKTFTIKEAGEATLDAPSARLIGVELYFEVKVLSTNH